MIYQHFSILKAIKNAPLHDITNNGVKKTLDNALKKANIERKIRFPSLRHTHASILLSQGVQVVSVSKRLGHANPTVTMQT